MIDRGGKLNVRAIAAMPRGRHSHGESRANAVQSQGRVEQRPRPALSRVKPKRCSSVTLVSPRQPHFNLPFKTSNEIAGNRTLLVDRYRSIFSRKRRMETFLFFFFDERYSRSCVQAIPRE